MSEEWLNLTWAMEDAVWLDLQIRSPPPAVYPVASGRY